MADTVFDRHPKKTLFAVLIVFGLITALLLEIGLRFIVSYDIGYYAAVKKAGVYQYPYGTISMNSLGYPDEEFDLSSTKIKRIGYYGDSVVYGVGAGDGYRFPDLLQEQYPRYEHWITGMISNGIQDVSAADMAEQFGLDTVVYAMNMNDLVPIVAEGGAAVTSEKAQRSTLNDVQNWVRRTLDGLRGKSYLYTATRTAVKNFLMRMGYSPSGFVSAELFPSDHMDIIDDVTQRINEFDRKLKSMGTTLCVIILPYEMQISNDAAETYKGLGIHWEDGFLDGSTQALIKERLNTRYVYDGLDAFKGLKGTAKVGEYFVYNKGDKIDFNHPNRAGHALLAEGFIKSKSCPALR